MAEARVVLVGAAGRMGAALTRALVADFDGQLVLTGAVVPSGHEALGRDAGVHAGGAPLGVTFVDELAKAVGDADVVVDFSSASAIPATLATCVASGRALMLGTTGYDPATARRIDEASQRIALLTAANTSLALNVLLNLVQQAGAALPPTYDIEIVETHHRHKVDAPSGTALALGHAAASGRGEPPEAASLTGAAPGPRRSGGVGYSVARGGDVVGEHEVRFLGPGEQLRLSHIATDRAIFARGALAAAKWLVGRAAGRYSMADVLGLKSKT